MSRLTWIVIIVLVNVIFVGVVNAIYDYDNEFMNITPPGNYTGELPDEPDEGTGFFSWFTSWWGNTWVGQFFSLLNPVTFFNALMSLPVVISGIIISFYLVVMIYAFITILRGTS